MHDYFLPSGILTMSSYFWAISRGGVVLLAYCIIQSGVQHVLIAGVGRHTQLFVEQFLQRSDLSIKRCTR